LSLIVYERDGFDAFGDGDDLSTEDGVRDRDSEGGGYGVDERARRDVRDGDETKTTIARSSGAPS